MHFQIRRMDREDKLWRKQSDENWRRPPAQICEIPLDSKQHSEMSMNARDPRLDSKLMLGSKIYRPERLIRLMPFLLDKIYHTEDDEAEKLSLEDGEIIEDVYEPVDIGAGVVEVAELEPEEFYSPRSPSP